MKERARSPCRQTNSITQDQHALVPTCAGCRTRGGTSLSLKRKDEAGHTAETTSCVSDSRGRENQTELHCCCMCMYTDVRAVTVHAQRPRFDWDLSPTQPRKGARQTALSVVTRPGNSSTNDPAEH